jgi:hypothetical protein
MHASGSRMTTIVCHGGGSDRADRALQPLPCSLSSRARHVAPRAPLARPRLHLSRRLFAARARPQGSRARAPSRRRAPSSRSPRQKRLVKDLVSGDEKKAAAARTKLLVVRAEDRPLLFDALEEAPPPAKPKEKRVVSEIATPEAKVSKSAPSSSCSMVSRPITIRGRSTGTAFPSVSESPARGLDSRRPARRTTAPTRWRANPS